MSISQPPTSTEDVPEDVIRALCFGFIRIVLRGIHMVAVRSEETHEAENSEDQDT